MFSDLKKGNFKLKTLCCVVLCTLWGDGVLGAAGGVGLAAVAAGALQGVSAGAVDVQLEASGQRSGQLLVGVPVLLTARHTRPTHTYQR